ncbi:MAG: hypothetical protein Q9161_003818 [Pseudevernia consocians]
MIRLILRERQQGGEHQQGYEQFQLVFSLAAAPEIDYFTVVLHGLGGIGKSQLAIEYAKKHRLDYTAVLWLNAKTEDTLKQSFAANARRLPEKILSQDVLYGPQNEEALGIILRETKKWLDLPGNNRWLLIYDNVDNPKIPDNKRDKAYDVRSYFPEAHQGSILVTTRWKTLRIGRPLEVAKLSEDEDSISLLEQTSGRNIRQDLGHNDLTKKLDGLPLALATAGGYLGLTGISVSEYLDMYQSSWLKLQKTSPAVLSYEDQTIYSTWNLSYILIRKEDELAAKLLELWAYFDNRDLWYALLKAGEDEAPGWFLDVISTKLAFNSVIGKLQKHALIERLTESDGYSMHHCVHAWVENVLCSTIEDQNMRLALTCVGQAVPVEPQRGDWIIGQRLFPHSERCLHLLRVWSHGSKDSEQIEECVISFFANLGTLCFLQGKRTEAESIYQRALTGYEKALGRDHRSTLETINNLGNLYCDQGKLTEAESMYQRALTGKEKAFGRDHTSTLDTINNLGALYWNQGKLTEAESMYQRALTGYEKAFERDHTSTLDTINNLGVLYRNQGKLTEAESMYQRALAGYGRNPPPKAKSQLDLFYNMGLLYRDLQNSERAKGFFSQAYEGYEKLLGSQNTWTIRASNHLNEISDRQGGSVERD